MTIYNSSEEMSEGNMSWTHVDDVPEMPDICMGYRWSEISRKQFKRGKGGEAAPQRDSKMYEEREREGKRETGRGRDRERKVERYPLCGVYTLFTL